MTKKRRFNEIVPSPEETSEKQFTSITETYRVFSLTMVMSLMYPNPRTEKRRLQYIMLLSASFVPAYMMWFYDVSICLNEMDIDTLTRQLSLGVPIMFCQFKMFYIYIVRKGVEKIFDEINRDYENANYIQPDYRALVENNRRSLVQAEKYWKWLVISTVSMFTIVAVIMTIDAYLFKEPKRYMIHEMRAPWLHDKIWETPYFELFFIYSLYMSVVLTLNYISYDGMFFVCIYHCCLKFTIVGHMLAKSFENFEDFKGIQRNIASAVEEHCKAYNFVRVVTKSYEVWLALVFALTVSQVCMNLYQLTTSDSMDPTYVIFLLAAVLHIFLPCHLVSKLSATSTEVADTLYCSGWERVQDREVRRSVAFIIARAQIPVQINAFDMLCFNMSLFVNVMQTSYSVLTLLRS